MFRKKNCFLFFLLFGLFAGRVCATSDHLPSEGFGGLAVDLLKAFGKAAFAGAKEAWKTHKSLAHCPSRTTFTVINELPYDVKVKGWALIRSKNRKKFYDSCTGLVSIEYWRMTPWERDPDREILGSAIKERLGEFVIYLTKEGGWFKKARNRVRVLSRSGMALDWVVEVWKDKEGFKIRVREFDQDEIKSREKEYKEMLDQIKRCKKFLSVSSKMIDAHEDVKKVKSKWDSRVSISGGSGVNMYAEIYKAELGELFRLSPSGSKAVVVGTDRTIVLSDPKQGFIRYIVLTMKDKKEPWNKSIKVYLKVEGKPGKFPRMEDVLVFPSDEFREKFGTVTLLDEPKDTGYRALHVDVIPWVIKKEYDMDLYN